MDSGIVSVSQNFEYGVPTMEYLSEPLANRLVYTDDSSGQSRSVVELLSLMPKQSFHDALYSLDFDKLKQVLNSREKLELSQPEIDSLIRYRSILFRSYPEKIKKFDDFEDQLLEAINKSNPEHAHELLKIIRNSEKEEMGLKAQLSLQVSKYIGNNDFQEFSKLLLENPFLANSKKLQNELAFFRIHIQETNPDLLTDFNKFEDELIASLSKESSESLLQELNSVEDTFKDVKNHLCSDIEMGHLEWKIPFYNVVANHPGDLNRVIARVVKNKALEYFEKILNEACFNRYSESIVRLADSPLLDFLKSNMDSFEAKKLLSQLEKSLKVQESNLRKLISASKTLTEFNLSDPTAGTINEQTALVDTLKNLNARIKA